MHCKKSNSQLPRVKEIIFRKPRKMTQILITHTIFLT
ncbi:hypothetical protein A5875_002801, partial [Enterococcus sp. 3H8_DIV0648]